MVKQVYVLTATFPKNEEYGLTSQLRRASVSIVANIAEGKQRYSKKEYLYFLYIAYSSCAEVEAELTLSQDLGYISKDKISEVDFLLVEIQKMLFVLIKNLKKV